MKEKLAKNITREKFNWETIKGILVPPIALMYFQP
jgi:hypothetical protein